MGFFLLNLRSIYEYLKLQTSDFRFSTDFWITRASLRTARDDPGYPERDVTSGLEEGNQFLDFFFGLRIFLLGITDFLTWDYGLHWIMDWPWIPTSYPDPLDLHGNYIT